MAEKDRPASRVPPESSGASASPSWQSRRLTVCLAGGLAIVRLGVQLVLESRDVAVGVVCANPEKLPDALGREEPPPCQAIVLILTDAGAFQTFVAVRDAIRGTGQKLPVVILTQSVSRAQVYTALRQGVKGYVSMDADPHELIKAIEMAVADKVYLSPGAAELVVSDISSSTQGMQAHVPKIALSRREVEIVQLLCDGLSSREAGEKLHISSKTVENHRYNIYRKCDVDSIAGLIRHAIRHGIVTV